MGRGVVSVKRIVMGEFICEYPGQLIKGQKRCNQREKENEDIGAGSYMYFFHFKNIQYRYYLRIKVLPMFIVHIYLKL